MQTIFYPSNNAFESLIFNQSPFNIFKMMLYIILEYQIIIVSRRPSSITLFCESMLELIRPL